MMMMAVKQMRSYCGSWPRNRSGDAYLLATEDDPETREALVEESKKTGKSVRSIVQARQKASKKAPVQSKLGSAPDPDIEKWQAKIREYEEVIARPSIYPENAKIPQSDAIEEKFLRQAIETLRSEEPKIPTYGKRKLDGPLYLSAQRIQSYYHNHDGQDRPDGDLDRAFDLWAQNVASKTEAQHHINNLRSRIKERKNGAMNKSLAPPETKVNGATGPKLTAPADDDDALFWGSPDEFKTYCEKHRMPYDPPLFLEIRRPMWTEHWVDGFAAFLDGLNAAHLSEKQRAYVLECFGDARTYLDRYEKGLLPEEPEE
jgi:hypothetical protein